MKEILKLLTHEVSRIAAKEVDPAIVRNSLLFTMASVMGLKRMHYTRNNVKKYANFFGITIAPSGEGKDLSLMVCEDMFANTIEIYTKVTEERFRALNDKLPTGDTGNEEMDFIVPSQYKVSLQGTSQGMMRVANFYNRTDKGSLNVVSTEFGHELNSDTLPVLTKLWQEAKADGSTNVNEKYPPVSDVPTNIILFGSNAPFERNGKRHDMLVETIESGLARRTYFVWSDSDTIRTIEYGRESLRDDIREYGKAVVENILGHGEQVYFSPEAEKELSRYKSRLIEAFNKTPSEWNRIKTSNIDKIERLAVILTILDMSEKVEPRHIDEAIEISEESDEAMEKVIRPIMPYVQMYKLLMLEEAGLTITEMIELGVRMKTKREIDDAVELLEEYAYRKNQKIRKIGKHKLALESLPGTDLQKIVVSVNMDKENPQGTRFAGHEVPFFGEKMTVEELVKSEVVPSFCLVHFENEKRNSKNAIPGQNAIAFDIDTGMTLEEAFAIFKPFTYIIYTTKSHRKEKNGETCDRFRILLPTKTMFYVNPEQHKGLITNIAELLKLPNYDVSTRNQDRLWYTNPNTTIYKNMADLLDIDCCIPDTEKEERATKAVKSVDETKISEDRRVQGMIKWTLANTTEGNRNNMLLRLHRFVLDLTGDKDEADRITYGTNSMLLEPLNEMELQRTVCR